MVETWQADPEGRFAHPDDPRGAVEWGEFRGFARCPVRGRRHLLDPHPEAGAGARDPARRIQAPHIAVSVFARGLLQRLVTRIYFGDEEEANAADPVLLTLNHGEQARRTP